MLQKKYDSDFLHIAMIPESLLPITQKVLSLASRTGAHAHNTSEPSSDLMNEFKSQEMRVGRDSDLIALERRAMSVIPRCKDRLLVA